MIPSCRPGPRAVRCVLLFLAAPALAQYGPGTTEIQPNNYPPALPERRGPPLKLAFELLGEIALPGPLGEPSAWIEGDRIAIPVNGGLARVAVEPGAAPELGPMVTLPASADWVEAASRKRRYRATPEGIVEAQRWSATRKRWVHRWTIVAPNSLMAMPALVGQRLCYAGLDDRVTCVRASNGHRLWSVDLGDRISRPIARWPDPAGEPAGERAADRRVEGEILLVVPDSGAAVIALDAFDGSRVATYELPPTRRFASPALVVDGDRIAVARKGYDEREAALVLLRLGPAANPASPGTVPYNGASPVSAGPPGR